jgi:hypothetical protein
MIRPAVPSLTSELPDFIKEMQNDEAANRKDAEFKTKLSKRDPNAPKAAGSGNDRRARRKRMGVTIQDHGPDDIALGPVGGFFVKEMTRFG